MFGLQPFHGATSLAGLLPSSGGTVEAPLGSNHGSIQQLQKFTALVFTVGNHLAKSSPLTWI